MKKITIRYLNPFAIFLLLIITTLNTTAFSEAQKCSINGQWFSESSSPMYQLKELDSKITMDEKIVDPTCGDYIINGTTDGPNFDFTFTMSNKEEAYCRTWINVQGTFTSADCTQIKGKMITHFEVLEPPGNEFVTSFSWYRNIVRIISPDPTQTLIITAEPKMPEFNAIATLDKPDGLGYLSRISIIKYEAPPFAWNVRLKHSPIPGKLDFDVVLDEVITNDSLFTPNFNLLKTAKEGELVAGGIMGGELTLSVDYYNAVRDEKKYTIKGTNPGQTAIEKILTDRIMRQIACQESRYKQFVAHREGGVGIPVIGLDPNNKLRGGAGIMQLYDPAPKPGQVWSWRENLKTGLKEYNDKLIESKHAHIKETIRLNKERLEMGLTVCPKNAISPLSQEQLNRETLRRYNCGREYRWEPRNAPNCEGKWVSDLSCKREGKKGYAPDYVERVLNCNINS
jgi:hypothetical protein